jgi:hypothetical protein
MSSQEIHLGSSSQTCNILAVPTTTPGPTHFQFHLKKAARNVSFNILNLQVLTHLYQCEACFHGIGSYSSQGRGHYKIPEELWLRGSINLFKLIGLLPTSWGDFLEGNLPPPSQTSSPKAATPWLWLGCRRPTSIARSLLISKWPIVWIA